MFDSPLCPAFSVIYNCCKFYLHSSLLYLALPSPNGSTIKFIRLGKLIEGSGVQIFRIKGKESSLKNCEIVFSFLPLQYISLSP